LVIVIHQGLGYPFDVRMNHSHAASAANYVAKPVTLLLLALGLSLLPGTGCSRPPSNTFQGYIEAEYVHVAAPLPGTLESLAVARGQAVDAGAPLYTLESTAEIADLSETQHRLAQARANLDNLQKGKRPSEIAALEAALDHAHQALKLAQSELNRRLRLFDERVIAVEDLERAQTQRDLDQARVNQLVAELDTARLGARTDEIRSAEAQIESLLAARDRAQWAVDQKRVHAPTHGMVHDTLYRPGEWVAAGDPVVVLLPPTNLKVRFFVPQDRLASLQPGQTVSVHADGSAAPYPATINYISTRAEFTPPVIYSRDTRSKLIFLIEAAFSSDLSQQLRPGQPVDVRLR
jgi:HlyD family secretion protein